MSENNDSRTNGPPDDSLVAAETEVESCLSKILLHHESIASALDQASRCFVGRRRRQALALSRFFAKQPAAQRVLRRPDAMAVCAPMLKARVDQPDQVQIEDAVYVGLNRIDEIQTDSGQWRVFLIYPIVLSLLAIAIAFAYLMFLVPIFDQMFQEFGLHLSQPTEFVVGCSRLLTRFWPVLAALAGTVLCVLPAIAIRKMGKDQPVWVGWSNRVLEGRHESLQQAASHLALLYESGMSIVDSLRIIASISTSAWVRGKMGQWATQIDGGRGNEALALSATNGCRLLTHAIGECGATVRDPNLPVGLLRTAGKIYRDRVRHRQSLLLAWVAPVTMLIACLCIGLLVVAMFLPLLSLIRSLSY